MRSCPESQRNKKWSVTWLSMNTMWPTASKWQNRQACRQEEGDEPGARSQARRVEVRTHAASVSYLDRTGSTNRDGVWRLPGATGQRRIAGAAGEPSAA